MFFDTLLDVSYEVLINFIAPLYKTFNNLPYRWHYIFFLVTLCFGYFILKYSPSNNVEDYDKTPLGIFRQIFDKKVYLNASAIVDYKFATINHVIYSIILVYYFVLLNFFSEFFYKIFNAVNFISSVEWSPTTFGLINIILLYAFTHDTNNFTQHWLFHKVPILWEFHKTHHSAQALTPITALRVHPVELFCHRTSSALLFGIFNGFIYAICSGEAAKYTVFASNVFSFFFYSVGLYHLRHSHIWYTYPKYIKDIYMSPSLHLIHHSNNPIHFDKNLGAVFTFWDRLFGTYYDPLSNEQHDITIGISSQQGQNEFQSVVQLFWTPFKRIWRLHLKKHNEQSGDN